MKNTINFRTKFSKFIKSDEEQQLFIRAFEKFLDFTSGMALALLWKLTYNPNQWTLAMIGLSAEDISQDMANVLRNELRYQYQNDHPDFLDIPVPDSCKAAFEELKNHSDCVVSATVYQRICRSFPLLTSIEGEINRISYLLNSESENHYYGGIKAIGFDSDEANCLKKYHRHIHNLFVVMVEDYNNTLDVVESHAELPLNDDVTDTSDLPYFVATPSEENGGLETLQETIKPVEAAHLETVESEKEAYDKSGFMSLTAENIFAHKELFASFVSECRVVSYLQELHSIGFDLNEIVNKAETISNFINVTNALLS